MARYTWDNYHEFLDTIPPSESDVRFFSSSKWLQPLLQETSSYKPVPFFARFDKEDNTDKFFNKTLKTTDTISHALGLIRADVDWQERVDLASHSKVPLHKAQTAADYILFVHLRPDLSGFHNTAHGGLLVTIFDEAMSAITLLLQQTATSDREPLFTANLNVSYLAPVELPCTIQVHIWLERREGRKWYVKGKLMDEKGAVKTAAEALWVSKRSKENL